MSQPTYSENECSCEKCQNMCRTPCIGTPFEMLKIMHAGYGDRLARTGWAAGMVLGTHDQIVPIVAPLLDAEKGRCTFFRDGLCELHVKGLKPTEGRYASCKEKPITDRKQLFETPLYKCIAEWEKVGIKI